MIAIRKLKQAEDGEPATLEPIAYTLDRALGRAGWYGIAPAGIDPKDYKAIADWTEANTKIFGFPVTETANPLDTSAYMRSFAIYSTIGEDDKEDTPETTKYAHVAFFCKYFNYEPGSETWNLKTLNLIEPASLTGTDMQNLKDQNINYYTTYAGKNVTQGGKMLGGEWIDVIRFRDWLKNDMQLRVVNLFVTRPKVPYTDSGIALVQNQMIASLKAGQDAGGIAETEFDADGNEIPGFVTSVPLSASLSASEKASRRLTKCKFKARLAGAIHFAELKGSLTYEL